MKGYLAVAGLGLLLAVSACGGGSSQTTTTNRLTTQEQEMKDMRRALDVGAISEEEYEEQREKILKQEN